MGTDVDTDRRVRIGIRSQIDSLEEQRRSLLVELGGVAAEDGTPLLRRIADIDQRIKQLVEAARGKEDSLPPS